MTTVSMTECADYSPTEVRRALDEVLAPLGTMTRFVSPGDRVLLKVNLLSRATPDRAVTTHPELVRATIQAVRSCGGLPTVGDSPGGVNTPSQWRHVSSDSGIAAVCAEENVPLVLFDDDVVRSDVIPGLRFGSFTLGRAVTDCDVLITLPKFKTHGFMMFTGAVKNLFGCIPGIDKAQFHLKVPSREDFGDMLIDLMLACKPSLAIMDAVVGMEGEGPAGGHPRHVGALLASADCVALDVVASAMAGLDPMEVYSNQAAARRGLGPSSTDEIEIVGADWRALAPDGFELPLRERAGLAAISRLLPKRLGSALRTWTTARPYLDSKAGCTRCKTCEINCPVDAIVVGGEGPRFDHETCIRCYCCQELCPPQVIGLKVPPIARIAHSHRSKRR